MQRIYFDFNDGNFARFVNFDNYKVDQVHIYVFGLDSKESKVVGRWDDKDLTESDIKSHKIKWDNLYDPKILNNLAYLSFHNNDPCFRLQLAGAKPIDIKIEREINKYIDFFIISDLAEKYVIKVKKTKKPNELLTVKKNTVYILRGTFSIKNFDLRNHPFLGQRIKDSHPNSPGRLFVTVDERVLTQKAIDSRPRGTILNFLFHQPDGKYLSKGLILK